MPTMPAVCTGTKAGRGRLHSRIIAGIAAHSSWLSSPSRMMVVAVAAGQQPNFTLNPMEPAATITSFIVQVALGDLPHGSIEYQSIFAAGLVLMLLTLGFNVAGHVLRRRFREVY